MRTLRYNSLATKGLGVLILIETAYEKPSAIPLYVHAAGGEFLKRPRSQVKARFLGVCVCN